MPPKVEGGEKLRPPRSPHANHRPTFRCHVSPKGLADADFLKTGAPIDAVGFTQPLIKKGFSTPDVLTKPASKSKVVIQKTEAKPAPCESFFSKAGTFSRTISLTPLNLRSARTRRGAVGAAIRKSLRSPRAERKKL